MFTEFSWSEKTTCLKSSFFPSSPSPPFKNDFSGVFCEQACSHTADSTACWLPTYTATLGVAWPPAGLLSHPSAVGPLHCPGGVLGDLPAAKGMASGQPVCSEGFFPLHWQRRPWTLSSCCFSGTWFCSINKKKWKSSMMSTNVKWGVSTVDKSQFGKFGGLIYTYIYICIYIHIILMRRRRGMTLFWGGEVELFSSCSTGPSKKKLTGSEKIGIFLKPVWPQWLNCRGGGCFLLM